jgi:hypothetical protein
VHRGISILVMDPPALAAHLSRQTLRESTGMGREKLPAQAHSGCGLLLATWLTQAFPFQYRTLPLSSASVCSS